MESIRDTDLERIKNEFVAFTLKNIQVYSLVLYSSTIQLSITGYGQSLFKKSLESVYTLYGRHFTTNYIVDSGTNNLVGRKMNIGLESGFNFDYKINKNWGIRSGVGVHIHFISEGFYGTKEIPDSTAAFPISRFEKIYGRGVDLNFSERVSIGITFKALYQFSFSEKYEINIAGGPYLCRYTPAPDIETITTSIPYFDSSFNTYVYTPKYEIDRKNNKYGPYTWNSKLFLEWQFDLEIVRKFKKYGAVTAGIKTHIGTKKFERAEFIIWPEFSDFRSKGHYTLNRSYIGIYAGYRFGKNHSK